MKTLALLLAFAVACSTSSPSPPLPPQESNAALSSPEHLPSAPRLSSSEAWSAVRDIQRKARTTAPKPIFASQRPPKIPGSWTQAAWFIDPVSGSDSNTCITSGNPCQHWAEIVARWGTNAPTFRQTTTVTFLSSQSDDTDPVIWKPILSNGANAILAGVLGAAQTIATGTLGSVTLMNRATPTLLKADVGASGAAGLLLDNTTQGHTRTWLYKKTSGTIWSMSTPCATLVAPINGSGMTVSASFVTGDAFTLYQPLTVNIVDLEPTPASVASALTALLYVQDLTIFDPQGASDDPVVFNPFVLLNEVNVQRYGFMLTQPTNFGITAGVNNCYLKGGWTGGVTFQPQAITGSAGSSPILIEGGYTLYAGVLGSTSAVALNFNGVVADYDAIVTIAGFFDPMFTGQIGDVYLDAYLNLVGISAMAPNFNTNVLWGPGTLNVALNAMLSYPAGTAAAAFLEQGGIKMNGLGTATSMSTSVGVGTLNTGVTTTPAHLDAAAGASGFGGHAVQYGGSVITSYVQ